MKRFTIDLDTRDLRERLHRTRWPEHATFGGGLPSDEMREIVRYWAGDFDWRRQQARLNEFEHFLADGIHFIRVRGDRDAIPLLLLHGWPGSFVEFLDVIPLLAGPFELVIPSLPGFGFSAKPDAPGMSTRAIAARFVSLMQQLGFARFLVQGGDFGAGIATWMAVDHPDRLLGMHLNYIPGSYLPPPGAPLTPAEEAFQRDEARWRDESGAYGHVQRTRPLTLGYALNDSPAGLAAWLVEKFREWADPASVPPLDNILTNVTIYWLTGTILSSIRLYGEAAKTPLALTGRLRVPAAIARFPLEEPFPPREWIERGYDVRRYTELPAGGHFAAMEQPALFARDITEGASALFRAPSAESPRR